MIAAGLGTRLAPLTDDRPKCLLPVGSKTMLEHQIEAFRSCGIEDIVVINGYCADLFPELLPELGVTYVTNPRFRQNNILNSLMCSEHLMENGFLASYSDLVYEPRMVAELLDAPGEIVISVDNKWRQRYAHLEFHPPEAVEKVDCDDLGRVRNIGKAIANDSLGEFVGLLRCSAPEVPGFRRAFAAAKEQYWGGPFVRAANFEQAYLTDFLQYLVDAGTTIHTHPVGDTVWVEVDTEEDLREAERVFG